MDRRPVIGVIPLVDSEKDSLWMLPGYMDSIENAGGLPVMLPLSNNTELLDQMMDFCDGFLFTGGHDIDPELYYEMIEEECGEIIELRDQMEMRLFNRIVEADKPLLGICRGLEMINVCLGGRLYQDLPKQYGTVVEHHQKPPYDQPVHWIQLTPESPLQSILNKKILEVNSYHHQGIKDLASGLEIMAEAMDGLAEAIYMPDKKFVWAVQWHPEFSYKNDEDSRKIIQTFVDACKVQE